MTEDVSHNQSVISLLEKLGLSRNEVKCYLASLELRPSRVSEIAKKARVHRVNAYDALRVLVEKGLVEQELTSRGKRIHPAPLEHLEELAFDFQKSATRLRWKLADLLPKLLAASNNTENTSVITGDVTLFQGEDAFYRVAERTLAVPAGSTVAFIESSQRDLFHLPDNPDYDETFYIPERMKRKIFAKVLHRVDKRGQALKKKDALEMRETRFLPSDVAFPCAIMIYGEEIAFLWQRDHVMGVVIHGNPIVDLMKLIFDLLWSQAAKK